MTALSAIRAACQRGEMPKFNDVINTTGHPLSWTKFFHAWDGGRYLDALAALQEALWPGSAVYTVLLPMGKKWWPWVTILNEMIADEAVAVSRGEPCPTEATARLDAILAGLEKEAGE